MKKIFKKLILILFIVQTQLSLAQSNVEKAYEKGMEAIKLMDNGDVDKSIVLLEEAKLLDPKNMNYPYEIAYANYLIKEYKSSIKILETLTKHSDVNDRVYQLLGNSYSLEGQREKAIATYEKGLEKFPNSGALYLERGNMEMFVKEYNKALDYYEKGIFVEPKFPSNYYWATKIYCSSTEEVWGMIYGEIFMNLERNSNRTSEISKLLFDTYKSEIVLKNENSLSVSFSQNATINASDLKNKNKIELPFGVGIYEPTLILSMIFVKSIDLQSLNSIRSSFVDNYFNNGHHKNYPNALFSYQKTVKDAGHMDAYNYWILMKGDTDEFVKWKNENKEKWDSFITWFTNNPLKINDINKFHSSQY
jgi:tetratricopeptide (TPR) repeat protein